MMAQVFLVLLLLSSSSPLPHIIPHNELVLLQCLARCNTPSVSPPPLLRHRLAFYVRLGERSVDCAATAAASAALVAKKGVLSGYCSLRRSY